MKLLPETDISGAIIYSDFILKDPPWLMLPCFTKITAVCMLKDVTCIQITEWYSLCVVDVCSACISERCLHRVDRWEPHLESLSECSQEAAALVLQISSWALGSWPREHCAVFVKWILGFEWLILGRKLLHIIVPVLILLIKFIKGDMQLNGIFQ